MDYKNRALVAKREFLHGNVLVRVDQQFYATPIDADYLKKTGRAEEAPAQADAPGPQARMTPAAALTPAVPVAPAPPAPPAPPPKLSEGLTVAEIRQKLWMRNIAVPDGVTLKSDLAALLDGASL